jgi:hypothetical protein
MIATADKALGCMSEELFCPVVLIKSREIGKLRPAFAPIAEFGDVFQKPTRFVA